MTNNLFDAIFGNNSLGAGELTDEDVEMKATFAVHAALHGNKFESDPTIAKYTHKIIQQVIDEEITEAQASSDLNSLIDHGIPPQAAFDEFANQHNETGEIHE